MADPPWSFGDKLGSRGAEDKYKVMSLQDIKHYALPSLADDCVLFLWKVASMQEEAFQVARAWGFTPTKGEFVWRKLTDSGKEHFGMGYIVRGSHESCVIATRGKPKALSHSIRSLFSAPVPRIHGKVVHSAKPELFFDLVCQLFDGPRVSLFERTQREGFTCIGDEIDETCHPIFAGRLRRRAVSESAE